MGNNPTILPRIDFCVARRQAKAREMALAEKDENGEEVAEEEEVDPHKENKLVNPNPKLVNPKCEKQ